MITVGYFNTGRQYTAAGQVVHATYDPETLELRFDDYSRMISGTYAEVSTAPGQQERWAENPEAFARFVMARYDRGGYQWAPTRARPVQELLVTRI